MTVVARRFVAIPARSALETWEAIVALIAPDPQSGARTDLAAVAGVLCSVITDETLREDALVVFGDGPRVRIYCLYGEDAIEGEAANETGLGFTPTVKDWRISVPCLADDLDWVSSALAKRSARVTARAAGTDVSDGEEADRQEARGGPPTIDRDALRRG